MPHVKNPETRLISEFMLSRFPNGGYRLRVPLGPPLAAYVEDLGQRQGTRASRPWRFEVDAVAWPGGHLALVEGKIFRLREGFSALPFYASLVQVTPELAPWRTAPIELWLVAPWMADWLVDVVARMGIAVYVYRPAWIDQYVEDQHLYHTREYRLAREERRRLREALGVE